MIKNLLIRSAAGQTTFGLVIYVMSIMPIGTAMILFQINPFWVSILACLLLKERIGLIEILGILVCFGGVIMIGFAKQQRLYEQEILEETAPDENNTPMV